jgi:hypothetical protein
MALKTVYIEFVAKTKKLTSGLNKADKKVKKSTALVKKMGIAIAGVFSVVAIKRAAEASLVYAKEVENLGRAFGLSADQAQRLLFLSDASLVDMAKWRDALKEITKRTAEAAEGNENYAKAFKKIGLDPKVLKEAKDLEQVMLVLRGLSSVPDSEKQFLADLVGGGQFAESFQRVFRDFEHFNTLIGEAGEVGTTVFDTKLLDDFALMTAKINHNLKQIGLTILQKVLPELEALSDWAKDNQDQVGEGLITLGNMVVGLKNVFVWVGELIGGIFGGIYITITKISDALGKITGISRAGGILDSLGFGPDDPINQPAPSPLAPFSMVPTSGPGPLSNGAFTQNNYYKVSGITAEQMDARARRQADTANKAGLR